MQNQTQSVQRGGIGDAAPPTYKGRDASPMRPQEVPQPTSHVTGGREKARGRLKISVIVTTWGCGSWVEPCLASVRRAVERVRRVRYSGGELPDVEVVEVCDGSGVWNARNDGIRRSTGDWLVFVDGDDEVDEDWLAVVAENAGRGDLVKARLDRFDGRPRVPGPGYWQACAFRRDVVPPDGFPPYCYGEDRVFLLRCMSASKRTVDVDRIVYHYRRREGSAVWRPASLEKFLSKRDYSYDLMKGFAVRSRPVAFDSTFNLTFDLFGTSPRPWDAWYEGLGRLRNVERLLPWPCRAAVRLCRRPRWHWTTWLFMYLPARAMLKVSRDD